MPWLRGQKEKYEDYQPPHMTDEQMRALELFIVASSDASEFAKKVIIQALRKTENLTRRVALSVWNSDYGPERTGEVQKGVHDMISFNGATRLDLFFAGMGTEMRLGSHCGCFHKQSNDPFDTEAEGRTIWFSYVLYDDNAIVLEPPPLAELDAMTLPM